VPSQSEETIITGIREVCSTFPKSSKAFLAVVHRESDGGAFSRTVERAAVISMKDAWQLENKSPTMSFAPSDEKALEYVRGVATSALQSACKMLVIVDLPANRIGVYVLSKGMCFVATAAYGSPLAPDVRALSQFRDQVLLRSKLGTSFVALYYLCSPPLASLIACDERLRAAARTVLKPIVKVTQSWLREDT
jgi:hypothetical protein